MTERPDLIEAEILDAPIDADRDRQIVAIRLAAPIRPHDRTSADVDGLDLFDFARSPRLI